MTLYFRLFLLVPMVFAIAGATVPVVGDIGLFQVSMVMMFAGFTPYLPFVVIALIWSFKHKHVNHTKAFVLAPFVFGLFCFVYGLFLAYTVSQEPPHLFVTLGIASTYSVYGIVVSALYSWTALGIWWLISMVRKPH